MCKTSSSRKVLPGPCSSPELEGSGWAPKRVIVMWEGTGLCWRISPSGPCSVRGMSHTSTIGAACQRRAQPFCSKPQSPEQASGLKSSTSSGWQLHYPRLAWGTQALAHIKAGFAPLASSGPCKSHCQQHGGRRVGDMGTELLAAVGQGAGLP